MGAAAPAMYSAPGGERPAIYVEGSRMVFARFVLLASWNWTLAR